MYYALGSNSVSDENYEAIKDNPWYMGSVGPELEAVYEAGCDMTNFFLDKGAGNIVIMSGGAASGNRLHQVRTWGMLNTLEEKAGLVLTDTAENLSKTDEITELTDKAGNVSEKKKIEFIIDKTVPNITIKGVKNEAVYEDRVIMPEVICKDKY